MRRTLRALPLTMVWPSVTWPSPAIATWPRGARKNGGAVPADRVGADRNLVLHDRPRWSAAASPARHQPAHVSGKLAKPALRWHDDPRPNSQDGAGGERMASKAAEIAARLDRLPATRDIWRLVPAALARRHVRVLRPVLHRPTSRRAWCAAAARTSTTMGFFGMTGSRASSPPLFPGLFIGTIVFCLRRRPLRPPHDLHLLAALVLRLHRHHGVPDHRARRRSSGASSPASASASSWSRSTPTSPSWCRSSCAAAPLHSTRPSSSRPCRSWRCSPGCWCRIARSVSTAGAGWC